MILLKLLSLYLFVVSLYASANSSDIIQEGLHKPWLVPEEANEDEDPIFEPFEEILLDDMLNPDFNKTDIEKMPPGIECTGGDGLLGFIQCILRTKIASFRVEFSTVAIPDQPPKGFKPHAMDPRVEGSLEEWFQNYKKYIESLNV